MACQGCHRTCLCSVLDQHSLLGFFTVLAPCKEKSCTTLNTIHREKDGNNIFKEDGKKQQDHVITPHVCPRFVMFVLVVLSNFFFYGAWSYVLVSSGDTHVNAAAGNENNNVADLKGRFGGRDLGEVIECYSNNNDRLTFEAVPAADISFYTDRSGCSIDVLNDYYYECRVPAKGELHAKSCKEFDCKKAVTNLFACLVAENSSTEVYQALSFCDLEEGTSTPATAETTKSNPDPKSKSKSASQKGEKKSEINDIVPAATVGTPLTKVQHTSVTRLAKCIKANCGTQRNEMIFQTITTIVLTAILIAIFESIVNRTYGSGDGGYCCNAECSHTRFKQVWAVILVLLLLVSVMGAILTASRAINKVKESAPQRCVYTNAIAMFSVLLRTYIPVLGATFVSQFFSLLLFQWYFYRKEAKEEESKKKGGSVVEEELELASVTN